MRDESVSRIDEDKIAADDDVAQVNWDNPDYSGKTLEFTGDVIVVSFKQLTTLAIEARSDGHGDRPGNYAKLTLTAGGGTWIAEDSNFENYHLRLSKGGIVTAGSVTEIAIAVTNSSATETSHSLVVKATRHKPTRSVVA